MEVTIWKNEKSTIDKIIKEAKETGKLQNYSVGHMSQSGDLKNNQRRQQSANVYEFKNSNNQPICLMENGSIVEFNYTYDKEENDQISIVYDKRTQEMAYYLHSGRMGHNLLALVSPKGAEFPVYGTETDRRAYLKKLEQIGELPDSEHESTVRATIEKTLLANPIFRGKAHEILAGFDQILSVDKDRQIQPLTPIEIENAKLKDRIEDMSKELSTSRSKEQSQADEIAALREKLSKAEEENSNLRGENEGLKAENQTQIKQIEKLQSMLTKTLAFATKVRDSIAGKLFFKKPLKDLNIDGQALPDAGEERE